MNARDLPPASELARPLPDGLSEYERLLAELSRRFISLPSADIDAAITDVLRQIVRLLEVDRCQLVRISPRTEAAEISHSWTEGGVPRIAPTAIAESFPWSIRRLRTGHAVVIPRVEDLPPEAAIDRASLRAAGTRSGLALPLNVEGKVEGAITLGCVRHARDWSDDFVARFGVLADGFAHALAHKRARNDLDAAFHFERTVSDMLAALLTAPAAEHDRVIEAGLPRVARIFGAERVALWRRNGNTREFAKTHRWVAEGVPIPPGRMSYFTTLWISSRLVVDEMVRFARHADLPPEAAADLPALRALGIRSGVMMPLKVSGAVVAAFSFATVRYERDWPDSLIPRIRILGDVLASVIARQDAERRGQLAQAQAAHATRMSTMGAVATSLVHEITQPLTASLANAEAAAQLLAAPSFDFDQLRAIVADVVDSDRRAAELIAQLRRFLRRGEAERSALDAREVIDGVLRIVAPEASARDVSLVLDVSDPLPQVEVDRGQIEQVLLNLLLNGLDAVSASAPEARRVAVRASPVARGLLIEVSDSGCGMDEQTLASAFQPFFTTKPEGMGLGLSISREIVSAHGGTLSAESRAGNGTTLRVELPAAAPSLRAERE